MDELEYKNRLWKIEKELEELQKREEEVVCSDEILESEKITLSGINEKRKMLEDQKKILIEYNNI